MNVFQLLVCRNSDQGICTIIMWKLLKYFWHRIAFGFDIVFRKKVSKNWFWVTFTSNQWTPLFVYQSISIWQCDVKIISNPLHWNKLRNWWYPCLHHLVLKQKYILHLFSCFYIPAGNRFLQFLPIERTIFSSMPFMLLTKWYLSSSINNIVPHELSNIYVFFTKSPWLKLSQNHSNYM